MTIGRVTSNSWLSCPKSDAARRMFCFPYAGGATYVFRLWQKQLPANIEICPIQLPGHGNRLNEPAFRRLNPLIRAIAKAILPYLNIPFALFGHSMGALIAFEFARLLRKEFGMRPERLFVSGHRAPQISETEPASYDFPESAFVEYLRELNGTPQDVLENSELIQLMLPVLRADFEMVQTYEHVDDQPLDCSITAFGGLQDIRIRRRHLEAWREHTTAEFSLHMIPGDHFFINGSQTLLLQILSRYLIDKTD